MRHFWWAAPVLFATCLLATPQEAKAQYKNWSYGFDGGYWWNTQYSVYDASTDTFVSPGNRTPRLSMGGRLGIETNYKLSTDRWWLTFKLNFGLLSFLPTVFGNQQEALMDQEANRTLGALLAVQGGIGLRFYFMTDRVRPYIQVAASYTRLFTFLDTAGQLCNADICGAPGFSNEQAYLPHPNAIGLHIQPGIEWLFTRDMGMHFFVDPQVLFVLNAPPPISIVGGIGIIIYT